MPRDFWIEISNPNNIVVNVVHEVKVYFDCIAGIVSRNKNVKSVWLLSK